MKEALVPMKFLPMEFPTYGILCKYLFLSKMYWSRKHIHIEENCFYLSGWKEQGRLEKQIFAGRKVKQESEGIIKRL